MRPTDPSLKLTRTGEAGEDNLLQLDSPELEPADEIVDDEDDGMPKITLSLRPPKEDRSKSLSYLESVPYEVETLAEADARLELIMRRLADCVKSKDYDVRGLCTSHADRSDRAAAVGASA